MIPGLSLIRLMIGSIVLVGGGIGAYALLKSDLPSATPLEKLPDLVHDRVAEEISGELPLPQGDARLILPPIQNDRNDALRTRLSRRIDRTGRYDVFPIEAPQPETWFESEVLSRLPDWLEGIPGFSKDSDVAPWLLEARVVERQDDDDALALTVLWHLRDLQEEGRKTATGESEETIEKSLFNGDYLQWRIGSSSPWLRLIGWLAVVLVPWALLRALAVEVLRKESNGWNAVLWLCGAFPGVVAGYFLTAFGSGWGGATLALLSAAVTIVFSYGWLNWLETTRR